MLVGAAKRLMNKLANLIVGLMLVQVLMASSSFSSATNLHLSNHCSAPVALSSPHPIEYGGFGSSVAIGNGIAIVASDGGVDYVFNSTTGNLKTHIPGEGDGSSTIGLGDGLIVTGNPNENSSAGIVYVFNETTYHLIRTVTSPNAQLHGWFGYAIAVGYGLIVVGAYGESASGHKFAGNVYVYDAKTLTLLQTLTSPKPQGHGDFGASLSIADGVIVVGALGTHQGEVYLYSTTTRALLATLTPASPQFGGGYGWSVVSGGGLVAVSAPFDTVKGKIGAGYTYVYNINSHALLMTLNSPQVRKDGNFGYSLALDTGILIVGAPGNSKFNSSGVAFLFSTTSGKLIATLTNQEHEYYASFGWSVAASKGLIIVGAILDQSRGITGSGKAFIYSCNS
jgi:hypothetical protein